jgi:ribosomal protein S18 acetylase RimI-like enzyme
VEASCRIAYNRVVQLRPAVPPDAADIARVHVRAWQVGYRGLLPDDYLDGLRAEDRASRYTLGDASAETPSTIVAVERSTLCGFVTTGPAREGTGGAGHLMALYVDPDHWGRGIGRSLIERGRAELAARGYREAVLWLLAGNERARRFYVADGWAFDGDIGERELWGIKVTDHRYRRALP